MKSGFFMFPIRIYINSKSPVRTPAREVGVFLVGAIAFFMLGSKNPNKKNAKKSIDYQLEFAKQLRIFMC
jgi:hypothetical protein